MLINRFSTFLIVLITLVCGLKVAECGHPNTLNLYRKTMDGCGFMYMPCTQYYTSINMGNGFAQSIRVAFDTTFNNLFVPLKGRGNQPLHYDSGFDPTRSKYYKDDTINYGYTDLSGKWYSDYMSLTVNQWFAMTFLVAQKSTNNLAFEPWDGVLGLGPSMASQAGTSNLILSLYQQNITNLIQFGLNYVDNDDQAQITLGGIDPNWAGNLQAFRRINYAQYSHWWIPMGPFTMNNQIMGCETGLCTAIIHSGISDIYGPERQVNELYRWFNINFARDHHTYVDCRAMSSHIELGFTFEGKTRYLSARQYVKRLVIGGGVRCYIPIYPNESADTWVLGTTFLSAYYVAVDVTQGQVLMSYYHQQGT